MLPGAGNTRSRRLLSRACTGLAACREWRHDPGPSDLWSSAIPTLVPEATVRYRTMICQHDPLAHDVGRVVTSWNFFEMSLQHLVGGFLTEDRMIARVATWDMRGQQLERQLRTLARARITDPPQRTQFIEYLQCVSGARKKRDDVVHSHWQGTMENGFLQLQRTKLTVRDGKAEIVREVHDLSYLQEATEANSRLWEELNVKGRSGSPPWRERLVALRACHPHILSPP